MNARGCYGLLACFDDAEAIVSAACEVKSRGYTAVDAFTPFPVDELVELLGGESAGVKRCVLGGALIGAIGGFVLQWYTAVHAYPFDIGGRPLNSWPAFLIITFELAVLGGALAGFFGMLALNGLPRLNHPLFGAGPFHLASRNRFFLLIEARDPRFDPRETRRLLTSLAASDIVEVQAS